MLFEDYMDYMFCYTINKFFNFSRKCLKKTSTICYATDHWRKWFNILLSYQICYLNPPLHCQNCFCNHYLPLHPQPNHILYLQPKEPNLYKDLSQGTVTKGIQIKIFFKKKIFEKFFFFENGSRSRCTSRCAIQIQIQPNLDPDCTSGSSSRSRSRFSKKIFLGIFTFPYVTIMKF